ncbi:hypothetical protein [Bacteroides sp. UBA939]|uniref:hypothetical protein n=1 Tax=Bacteroides sp. UBA939 TaxID=1946092 RepID=UPI0025BB61CE|nr:hypothetical protein [Bacteroides sp. UBA939]
MQENFNDAFAVGIIDKDKQEVPYLKNFELVASNDSLYLHKHNEKHHYIIQISPAIERFILKAAEEKGIDITATYGLPTDLKKLTKRTKQIAGKNENDFNTFKRLFRELSDAPELERLAKLIRYLGENTYSINREDAKRIIEE